ncbi:MAG: hypothetical protein HYX24_05765 [Candidatus Aenigmarchaeota archaeon]|nr:hypothetical protein [Candidatus Aenigmarchaeota archaeon]
MHPERIFSISAILMLLLSQIAFAQQASETISNPEEQSVVTFCSKPLKVDNDYKYYFFVNKGRDQKEISLDILKGEIENLENLYPGSDKGSFDGKRISAKASTAFVLHGPSNKELVLSTKEQEVDLAPTEKCGELAAFIASSMLAAATQIAAKEATEAHYGLVQELEKAVESVSETGEKIELTPEQRLAQWGDSNELKIDLRKAQEYMDVLPVDLEKTRYTIFGKPKEVVYGSGDKVKLVRINYENPERAKYKIENGKEVSVYFGQANENLQKYFDTDVLVSLEGAPNHDTFVNKKIGELSLSKLLEEHWTFGKFGISTTYNKKIRAFGAKYESPDVSPLETPSTDVNRPKLVFELEVPAERIVVLKKDNLGNLIIPKGFSLDKPKIEKYGFVEPTGTESEITFLWEVPREYIKDIRAVPTADGQIPEILKGVKFRPVSSVTSLSGIELENTVKKFGFKSIEEAKATLKATMNEYDVHLADYDAQFVEGAKPRLLNIWAKVQGHNYGYIVFHHFLSRVGVGNQFTATSLTDEGQYLFAKAQQNGLIKYIGKGEVLLDETVWEVTSDPIQFLKKRIELLPLNVRSLLEKSVLELKPIPKPRRFLFNHATYSGILLDGRYMSTQERVVGMLEKGIIPINLPGTENPVYVGYGDTYISESRLLKDGAVIFLKPEVEREITFYEGTPEDFDKSPSFGKGALQDVKAFTTKRQPIRQEYFYKIGVLAESERLKMIKAVKAAGFTEFNGLPIEEFVIVISDDMLTFSENLATEAYTRLALEREQALSKALVPYKEKLPVEVKSGIQEKAAAVHENGKRYQQAMEVPLNILDDVKKSGSPVANKIPQEVLRPETSPAYAGLKSLAGGAVYSLAFLLGEDLGIEKVKFESSLLDVSAGAAIRNPGLTILAGQLAVTAGVQAGLISASSILARLAISSFSSFLTGAVVGGITYYVVAAVYCKYLNPLSESRTCKSIFTSRLEFSEGEVARGQEARFVVSSPALRGHVTGDLVDLKLMIDKKDVVKISCNIGKSSTGEKVCLGSFSADLPEGKHIIYAAAEVGFVPEWFEDLKDSLESGKQLEIPRSGDKYLVEIDGRLMCVQGISEEAGSAPVFWEKRCTDIGNDLKGKFAVYSVTGSEVYNAVRISVKGSSVSCEQFVLGDNPYRTTPCDRPSAAVEGKPYTVNTVESELIVTSAGEAGNKVKVKIIIETDKGTFETKPFDWADEKVLTKDDFVAVGPWERPVP